MKSAAVSISKGDQTDGLSIQSDSIEISALADALNSMVAQQNERIHTITNQRNKIETVLSSMTEGVLALDDQENVISLNNAAAKLFSVEVEQVEGRPFREIVRNRALLELASKTIVEGENSESDLVLEGENEKHLQVHGATLRDSQGKAVGAVIVLNDITKIRRLETIRRDFVANVSHELKTPITLIKGFVETLLQGAIDNRDESERFLKIMEKQVNRLNLIIDDLLSLSRLEQDHGRSKIDLEEAEVKVILESAIRDCELNTKNKSSTIQLNCEEGLKVPLNPPLIHQAVLNLVDNALKYSEPEALVEITASKNGSDLIIEVKDQGCGIDSKNLPRLFERFYRVDQARGRKLGGTGLGLAIVKHIAQAHGGRVSVDSTLGKGSRFSIHIPINQTPTDPGLAE